MEKELIERKYAFILQNYANVFDALAQRSAELEIALAEIERLKADTVTEEEDDTD